MARSVRPDIETARVLIAALHDMAYLYPDTLELVQGTAGHGNWPNAALIAGQAVQMAKKNARP